MGLFDNAKDMAKNGAEDALVAEGTGKLEEFIDNETGHKFDGAVKAAGAMADGVIDSKINSGFGSQNTDQNQ